MALNWAVLTPETGRLLPLPNEKVFTTFEDVRLEYESGNGYPGSGASYFIKRGHLLLTSHRIVYFASSFLESAAARNGASSSSSTPAGGDAAGTNNSFHSLSVPLRNIQRPKLNQPWFGANNVEMEVTPVPGGGLTLTGTAKFFFDKGAAFEMYSQLATIMQRELPDVALAPPMVVVRDEPLPMYPGAAEGSSSGRPRPSAAPATAPASAPPVPEINEAPPGYDVPPADMPPSGAKRPL
ncbi:hypothetical protein H9P43_003856 [Blastocladiella emersonii ATCC 22665]|nr:hypothetical protein H9P43_003856 [Blastocladiella emersonii ATCC 22665]